MYRPADTKLHNSIFLPVLWSQNYLFSAPAPSLSLVSAPAPALAKYCHLKLYCTIKVFLHSVADCRQCRAGAGGAEIIFLINICCSQFRRYEDEEKVISTFIVNLLLLLEWEPKINNFGSATLSSSIRNIFQWR